MGSKNKKIQVVTTPGKKKKIEAMKDTIFKATRNIRPVLRGAYRCIYYNCVRSGIHFGSKIRIGRGVDFVFHPGCKIEVGIGVVIGRNATIAVSKKGRFNLGTGASIGEDNHIICHNHISIGNNTLLGPGIMIYDHNHKYLFETGVDRFHFDVGEVIVGNNSWVGANAVILKGVHIGNNVIIGAGSVVTKDIPSNCIAAGIPAKVIKRKE